MDVISESGADARIPTSKSLARSSDPGKENDSGIEFGGGDGGFQPPMYDISIFRSPAVFAVRISE